MQENKKDRKIRPAILLQGWKLQSHDQGVIKLSMTFINVTSLRFLSGIWPWKLVMPGLEKTYCLFIEKIYLWYASYFLLNNYVNVDKVLWVIEFLPCLTDTYLALDAATKLACGNESSSEKSSSLVTVGDLVFKTDLEPMGAR